VISTDARVAGRAYVHGMDAQRETYVVGHDGSQRADEALAFAAGLARARSAGLLLVHVLPADERRTAGTGAREEATRLLERAREMVADIPCRLRSLPATSVPRGLQGVAGAARAQLIAVGATCRVNGAGGPSGVGERLARASPSAVAVTPAGWSGWREDARAIACAFDGRRESWRALSAARALAAALSRPLRLVGVPDAIRAGHYPSLTGDPARDRRERLRSELDAAVAMCGPRARGSILEGPVEQALVRASGDAVLIVAGTRCHGALAGGGSVSQQLVRHAACPVVVVPHGATAPADGEGRSEAPPSAADHGLLSPAQVGLLIDQYELTMAQSYLRRHMDGPVVFELFVRHLPARRRWLVAAGLGPALSLVERMRFGAAELDALSELGFDDELLAYLETFRFEGDIDAMPEGTIAFANEPLLRVTAPRIEAQLLETLLLNQLNFQTAIATKAALIALAAGGGDPAGGARVVDFSPRRDHGTDAAMKAARCAAIAGATGTSCVAAAVRYGLRAVGTMAHSYVLSFEREEDAFRAFLEDNPRNATLLVDTYDTVEGVRAAIRAARATGVALQGIRLDSGDLLSLSREARRLLDEADMPEARILASGDLEEHQIARLVAAGAPIDVWGVGTELGTSRDAPAVGGVYKLVADRAPDGRWRPVAKRSTGKATIPWPKQVFRHTHAGEMAYDVIARADEHDGGEPLLVPAMRNGTVVHAEPLDAMRARAARWLRALPRRLVAAGDDAGEYEVRYSDALARAEPTDPRPVLSAGPPAPR